MRTAILVFAAVLIIPWVMALPNHLSDNPPAGRENGMLIDKYNLQPLAFTVNQGQWDERIKFKADAGGANMWFTEEGVCYQFIRKIVQGETSSSDPFIPPHERFYTEPDSFEQIVLKASFVGANPNPTISGKEMLEYKCNYFIDNDPNEWHTDVPNYQAVYFEEIYPGIDLKYYGNGRQMEYDLIVSRGTDYSQIQIQYEGAKSLSVNSSGELVVETEWGCIVERKPIVFQLDGSERQELEGKYNIIGSNTFSFDLDNNYNPDLSVVIDPVLVYSTYLGGSDGDIGLGIAVDAYGCAYITGVTASYDFPLVIPYQRYMYDVDVFITKFSSNGDNLIYSTYLGADGIEWGNGIALDTFGCAYVTGYTSSINFPTNNPYQMNQDYDDVFISKLSSTGDSLIFSTYLGGSNADCGYGIAVDSYGCAFVAGFTYSTDFPTVNPYQTHQGYYDAFVTKLSSAGDNLIYSTYLGDNGPEWGDGIALDESGCAYVTGHTGSPNFPTVNPYQTYQGSNDVFITKLSSIGDNLIYSTYLGGINDDWGCGIALDASGCAYVTGYTQSPDFPIVNPYQTALNNLDIFITKLSDTGTNLIYSTYLGGRGGDYAYGIALDVVGCAYVIGFTRSIDFPTVNPFQAMGYEDVIVTKLSRDGDNLIYSTYLGGSGEEWGYGIDTDESGCAYVTGTTRSANFPMVDPYQAELGYRDAFVAKLSALNYMCGDVNDNNEIDVGDVVFLINYIFISGPIPDPFETANVNCDRKVSLVDIIYLIDYIFRGGYSPCDTTGDGVADC